MQLTKPYVLECIYQKWGNFVSLAPPAGLYNNNLLWIDSNQIGYSMVMFFSTLELRYISTMFLAGERPSLILKGCSQTRFTKRNGLFYTSLISIFRLWLWEKHFFVLIILVENCSIEVSQSSQSWNLIYFNYFENTGRSHLNSFVNIFTRWRLWQLA